MSRIEVHDGESALVEFMYPDMDQEKQAQVEIGLEHVRAADSIKVTYDFERDGWVIWQASKFRFYEGEPKDEKWREAAFCQAWQFQEDEDDDESVDASPPPTWTRTPPSDPGLYHVRYSEGDFTVMRRVYRDDSPSRFEQDRAWELIGVDSDAARATEELVSDGCEFWPYPIQPPTKTSA